MGRVRAGDNPVLEAAAEYARMGWALLPLAPRDKRPHADLLPRNPATGAPEWKPLAVRRANLCEIGRWFQLEPQINIGVICGAASGGLVVADFDCLPPGEWHMPLTPRVVTPRGEHVYFQTDDGASCGILLHRGRRVGEIRGDGGYVVLPPSIHPTGAEYQWAECLSPTDLCWTLADPPVWLAGSTSRLLHPPTREVKRVKHILYSLHSGKAGDGLGAWCSRVEFVQAAAWILGIGGEYATEAGIGKAFRCILPGHSERHPSASLYRRRDGLVVYRDWHAPDGEQWYYLAEVYASQAYGRALKLNAPELAVWQMRMLIDTGFLTPARVDMPALPRDTKKSVRRVYEGFRLLLGCKWLHTHGEPTAFTWRFAAAWCGVSERMAGVGIAELLGLRVIRIVGKEQCASGAWLTVFLPGVRHADRGGEPSGTCDQGGVNVDGD